MAEKKPTVRKIVECTRVYEHLAKDRRQVWKCAKEKRWLIFSARFIATIRFCTVFFFYFHFRSSTTLITVIVVVSLEIRDANLNTICLLLFRY